MVIDNILDNKVFIIRIENDEPESFSVMLVAAITRCHGPGYNTAFFFEME